MNASRQPASEPNADDGLDRLLRDYYRAKMPREFPPLPLDTVASARSHPASSLSRGRLLLVACVVVVVLGLGFLLGDRPSGSPQAPVGIGGSKAVNTDPHKAPNHGTPMGR